MSDKYSGSFRVFKVVDSEKHWVVAQDVVHAIDIVAKEYGFESFHTYKGEVDDVTSLAWDEELTVKDEEEEKDTTKTCADWARECRGIIASTVL